MIINRLKQVLKGSSSLPWQVDVKECDTVFGECRLPLSVKSPDRFIVHEEQGLLHGYHPGKEGKVGCDVELVANAKLNTAMLLKALLHACGGYTDKSEAKAESLLQHARKEVFLEAGLVEDEVVFTDCCK